MVGSDVRMTRLGLVVGGHHRSDVFSQARCWCGLSFGALERAILISRSADYCLKPVLPCKVCSLYPFFTVELACRWVNGEEDRNARRTERLDRCCIIQTCSDITDIMVKLDICHSQKILFRSCNVEVMQQFS